MSDNSFNEAVRQALAKKQQLNHPKAKKSKQQREKNPGVPIAAGQPLRKASGRGG